MAPITNEKINTQKINVSFEKNLQSCSKETGKSINKSLPWQKTNLKEWHFLLIS